MRDHTGQALACVYFEDEPGRRSTAKLITMRRRLIFQEDKMSESDFVRDLVQEGIRQAMQLEALKNIRPLINTAWFAIIITPVVLTLILWRVW